MVGAAEGAVYVDARSQGELGVAQPDATGGIGEAGVCDLGHGSVHEDKTDPDQSRAQRPFNALHRTMQNGKVCRP